MPWCHFPPKSAQDACQYGTPPIEDIMRLAGQYGICDSPLASTMPSRFCRIDCICSALHFRDTCNKNTSFSKCFHPRTQCNSGNHNYAWHGEVFIALKIQQARWNFCTPPAVRSGRTARSAWDPPQHSPHAD